MLKQGRNGIATCSPLSRQSGEHDDLATRGTHQRLAVALRERIDARPSIAAGSVMGRKVFHATHAHQQARDLMMEAQLTISDVLRSTGSGRTHGYGSNCPPTEQYRSPTSVFPMPAVAA